MPYEACLPLKSINHVSLVVSDLTSSISFYKILGFLEVNRPSSLNQSCDGAWLWRQDGLGIHLIKGKPLPRSSTIDPQSDHISFQASCSLDSFANLLSDLNIKFLRDTVTEGPFIVEQIFFHDPDNFMIEVCNCECLPTVLVGDNAPSTTATQCSIPLNNASHIQNNNAYGMNTMDSSGCCSEMSEEYCVDEDSIVVV